MGRYVLLGTLALIVAWLTYRRRDAAGGACGVDLACRQCAELAGCQWARAAETRREIGSGR